MKIHSVGVKLFHADKQTDRRTDGWIHRHEKLIVTICNFVTVPKNWNTSHKCMHAHARTHARTHTHTHALQYLGMLHIPEVTSVQLVTRYYLPVPQIQDHTYVTLYSHLYLLYCVFTHILLVSIVGVAEDNDSNIE
jgi:hypothetical protein